ncbi:MAG: transporter substrate-binding domain-containing protein [Desulfobacter sp.]|nr:transporter substrate-binding domain-containing protein [Desulfobacter sp.]
MDCRRRSKAKINVVYTDWFPYTCQRKQIPSGFEIDIFNSVIEKMNLRAAFKMLPWVRCLKYLEQGKADVLISMLKTPERERYAYYPEEHISVSKTMFFKKSNTHIAFNGSYEELKGYTIGVILGFSYGTAFDQARYLDKDVSIDTKMLITKLLKGRNDLAAENHAVMIAKAFQFGIKDDIQSFGPPIHTQKLYAGFSKIQGLEKICHDFSVHLCDFKKSKQYQAIFEKYGIEFTDMMEPKKKNIGIDI